MKHAVFPNPRAAMFATSRRPAPSNGTKWTYPLLSLLPVAATSAYMLYHQVDPSDEEGSVDPLMRSAPSAGNDPSEQDLRSMLEAEGVAFLSDDYKWYDPLDPAKIPWLTREDTPYVTIRNLLQTIRGFPRRMEWDALATDAWSQILQKMNHVLVQHRVACYLFLNRDKIVRLAKKPSAVAIDMIHDIRVLLKQYDDCLIEPGSAFYWANDCQTGLFGKLDQVLSEIENLSM